MGKNQVFRKVLDENGEPLMVDGDFVSELVYEEEVPDTILPPNWRGLTESLYASPLMFKAMNEANPNAFAIFLKVLTDGEAGNSTENTLKNSILMMGLTFSDSEKAELNLILTNNNFTIQI
jgi:hypothetical protein